MIRSFHLALAAGVLLLLACGNKSAPKSVAGVPGEAFAPLTETDVARFARALPAVNEYLSRRDGPASQETRVRDKAAKVLGATIEWVPEVDGIDSVFAANGVDWPFFRAMLYRVAVCAWTVGLEQTQDECKRIIRAQPTGAMAAAIRKRLRQMKEVAAAVPESNLEVFKRHYQDLRGFFYIVDAEAD